MEFVIFDENEYAYGVQINDATGYCLRNFDNIISLNAFLQDRIGEKKLNIIIEKLVNSEEEMELTMNEYIFKKGKRNDIKRLYKDGFVEKCVF